MREHPWLTKLIEHAFAHPLPAAILALFFILTLGLGVLHDLRILGDCFVVLLDHIKDELTAGRQTLRRIKRSFTTWDRARRISHAFVLFPKPRGRRRNMLRKRYSAARLRQWSLVNSRTFSSSMSRGRSERSSMPTSAQ